MYNNMDNNNKRRHRKIDGGEIEGRNLLVLGDWNARIGEQARMETQEKDKWKMKKVTCEGKRIL